MSSDNPNTKHRDAASGQFVTEEYANANPDTTVAESENRFARFMKQLANSGAILNSKDLSAEEVSEARAEGRYLGDPNELIGYVYMPMEKMEAFHGGA